MCFSLDVDDISVFTANGQNLTILHVTSHLVKNHIMNYVSMLATGTLIPCYKINRFSSLSSLSRKRTSSQSLSCRVPAHQLLLYTFCQMARLNFNFDIKYKRKGGIKHYTDINKGYPIVILLGGILMQFSLSVYLNIM